jgi:hypothetical protein
METLEMTNRITKPNYYPISARKYLLITLAQLLFNITVFPLLLKNFHEPMFTATVVTTLFTFPIISLIGGIAIALIPFKKLGFKTKYWPSVLIFYFILNSAVMIVVLFALIKFVISGELDSGIFYQGQKA